MKSSKSLRPKVSALIFLFLISSKPAVATQKQSAVVREALTGDTVRLEGGPTLKYIGLQAPLLQNLIPLVRQYGENSLSFNKDLVAGKKIQIEWGSQLKDEQNNLLGYAFLEDGRFVNEAILKAGHARLKILPPNIRYSGRLRQAELDARRNKRGLWKEEPQNPYIQNEYIGEINTKLYYFPTSPELDRIPKAQLVSFKSRVDAKAAGYRPCPTCHEDEGSTVFEQ